VNAWSVFSILLSFFFVSCGRPENGYDVNSSSDRTAMILEIQSALTTGDCSRAILNSKKLFESDYSDNLIRMLYANSLACKAGFRMLDVINELTSFTSPNALGQFARVFPSVLGDQKLESGWLAQDALQSILNPGSVVGAYDQIFGTTLNPGSVLATDRTTDSNFYGFFMSMSNIGNTLSRYGNTSAATGGGWGQGTDLVWEDELAVQHDLSGTACGLASGFLNFIDGFSQIQSSGMLGSASSVIQVMVTGLETQVVDGGAGICPLSGGLYACEQYYNPGAPPTADTIARCTLAKNRLRFRGACSEHIDNAIFAGGMIKCINALWF